MVDAVKGRSGGARPSVDAGRLEQLNLEQTLVDLELANARVVDLTGRLTSMSADVLALRAEVGNLQLVLAQERAELARIRRRDPAALARGAARRLVRAAGRLARR